MKLSIVIPCWNSQEFIADTIESALDQTVKCEIVFVNDGSTDNSLSIARNYPIRIIDQVNKGLPSARNTGIMNAAGDYVLPLDSDDMIRADYAEKILERAEESHADVIYGDMKAFGLQNYTAWFGDRIRIEDLLKLNCLSYCSAVRRSALLAVGGYNPKMSRGYEDYDLWIDLCKKGYIFSHIKEPMHIYRVREGSMITRSKDYHFDMMLQMRKNHAELSWNHND